MSKETTVVNSKPTSVFSLEQFGTAFVSMTVASCVLLSIINLA